MVFYKSHCKNFQGAQTGTFCAADKKNITCRIILKNTKQAVPKQARTIQLRR